MKVQQRITIACNKCGREFEASEEATTLALARQEAREQEGWTNSGSTVDRCADCAGPNASSKKTQSVRKESQDKRIIDDRNRIIIELIQKGHPPAEVATAVGVSRQRVYQILQEK